MSSSKPRNLFRGWNRHESYWDSEGMNENLQFLEGHVPFNIVGQYPANPSAPREGDVVIRKSNGTYKIWQTGLNVQAPTWVEYPASQGLLGFDARTNKLWFNDGSIWKDETEIGLATLSAVATAIANAITAHENATNPHPQYATIDQLNTAIDALEDLHLVGWQSYNSTTNTLTAIMSDGTTVAVDLTALVNDAITTVPTATDTVKGIVENATTVEVGEGILDGAVSISPANLLGALIASPNNALQNAIRAVSKTFVSNGTNTTVSGDGTTATPYQISVPEATRTVKGVVQLVKASDFPAQQNSELLGVSPSYIKSALDALIASIGNGVTFGTAVTGSDSPAPTDGNTFFRNTDTNELFKWDGVKWSVVADYQTLFDSATGLSIVADGGALVSIPAISIIAPRDGVVSVGMGVGLVSLLGASVAGVINISINGAVPSDDVFSSSHFINGTSTNTHGLSEVKAGVSVQAGDVISFTVRHSTIGGGFTITSARMKVQYTS